MFLVFTCNRLSLMNCDCDCVIVIVNSESGTKMTAIDCAPVNSLSLPAGGPTGCQCAVATQLEPGLERGVALVLLGVLGGGGEAPAALRRAVSRCVSARNRLGSGRKVGRRRCRRSMATVRSTACAGPQHPHFHGLHGQFQVAAKHGHPVGSPVLPIIRRDRGTPELICPTRSCTMARLL
eukprot:COSAG03_NODE_4965_length_1377_cov_5.454617_1_plen_180_part_00